MARLLPSRGNMEGRVNLRNIMIEPNSECRIFATTNGDRLFHLRDLNGVDVMDLVIA
jgi:hypothetical protein